MLYPSNYVNKIINRIIWVTQKNIEVEENRALKKEELKEKIRKNSSFNGKIQKAKSISIWIFISTFIAINTCLNTNHSISWIISKSRRHYSHDTYLT